MSNSSQLANTLLGADAFQNELLRCLIAHHPDGRAVLHRALTNARALREKLIASTQPEAVLSGLDTALSGWAEFLAHLESLSPS